MKINEIQIGGVYWTKIGQGRVQVKVVGRTESDRPYGFHRMRMTRFKVRREDNGKTLPKDRAASSLHATKYAPRSTQRTAGTVIIGGSNQGAAEIDKAGAIYSTPLEQALATSDLAKANERSWDSAMPGPNDADSADEEDGEE